MIILHIAIQIQLQIQSSKIAAGMTWRADRAAKYTFFAVMLNCIAMNCELPKKAAGRYRLVDVNCC